VECDARVWLFASTFICSCWLVGLRTSQIQLGRDTERADGRSGNDLVMIEAEWTLCIALLLLSECLGINIPNIPDGRLNEFCRASLEVRTVSNILGNRLYKWTIFFNLRGYLGRRAIHVICVMSCKSTPSCQRLRGISEMSRHATWQMTSSDFPAWPREAETKKSS
jgi:hypothetical protein